MARPTGAATGVPPTTGSSAVVSPVVVISKSFSARPAAWVEAQEFLGRTLGELNLEPAGPRVIQEAIGEALLTSARPEVGTFQIAVRIFPDEVEVEVLSDEHLVDASTLASPPVPDSFADWIAEVLHRQGLSQEAAARQLGVSVRTVGRWVRGQTEPRLRDLRRVHEVFGLVPPGPKTR
jgi:DNA-binding transcriptional regulator YiaG